MNTAARVLRLGFAGTPQFAVPALEALYFSRHRMIGVFTPPDRPAGRGRSVVASSVKRRAIELGLPVHQPSSFRTETATALLRSLGLDALVVVAYGHILPAPALAIPHLGCFNIHASLLPRWRGAAPIQRALLAGDAVTGVTIMRMEAGLDTGPMLAIREIRIGERDTAGSLNDRLSAVGAELIVDTIDAIAAGRAREETQPPIGVIYAEKVAKAEASIDWSADSLSVLRRVRAFNPWPIAQTAWQGQQIRIWEAELGPARQEAGTCAGAEETGNSPHGTVLAATTDGIDVACGTGVLRVLKLQLAGRKPLVAEEFIKSQRLAGARLESP